MILVSSCNCLCPIHWSQVLSREWICSWSSADRRCSNYTLVIANSISFWGASCIRGLTVRRNRFYLHRVITNNMKENGYIWMYLFNDKLKLNSMASSSIWIELTGFTTRLLYCYWNQKLRSYSYGKIYVYMYTYSRAHKEHFINMCAAPPINLSRHTVDEISFTL